MDDRRPLPENSIYNCVRSYEECIFLLRNFRTIRYISLDFDLGEKSKTGLDVLKYMKENGNKVEHINLHTDNTLGLPLMQAYAEENFPDTQLTFRHL